MKVTRCDICGSDLAEGTSAPAYFAVFKVDGVDITGGHFSARKHHTNRELDLCHRCHLKVAAAWFDLARKRVEAQLVAAEDGASR